MDRHEGETPEQKLARLEAENAALREQLNKGGLSSEIAGEENLESDPDVGQDVVSAKYVGEWKDDKHHGQGTLTWPSGQTYVGEFKDIVYEKRLNLFGSGFLRIELATRFMEFL